LERVEEFNHQYKLAVQASELIKADGLQERISRKDSRAGAPELAIESRRRLGQTTEGKKVAE
jgi:hypothetical protein